MPSLDPTPARNLTDREVAKIIGSLVGGLSNMSTKTAIRTALQFQLDHLDTTYTIATQFEAAARKLGRQEPRT